MTAHRYDEGAQPPLPRARLPKGVSIEAREGHASLVVYDEVIRDIARMGKLAYEETERASYEANDWDLDAMAKKVALEEVSNIERAERVWVDPRAGEAVA